MAEYTSAEKRGKYKNRLHELLSLALGGTQADYQVYGNDNDLRVVSSFVSQQALEDYCNAWDSLILLATPDTILEDSGQSLISCAGLTSFDYNIYWIDEGRQLIASGNGVDGQLNFSTDTAGSYLIEFVSGQQTGYTEVICQSA